MYLYVQQKAFDAILVGKTVSLIKECISILSSYYLIQSRGYLRSVSFTLIEF